MPEITVIFSAALVQGYGVTDPPELGLAFPTVSLVASVGTEVVKPMMSLIKVSASIISGRFFSSKLMAASSSRVQ